MADVRPFAAVRVRPELAGTICCPPYDVLSVAEARALAATAPACFVRVTRAEIDLPDNVPANSPAVYQQARENFLRMMHDKVLIQDSKPCYYVYRLTFRGHAQTGLVGLVGCRDYLDGIVRPHELTRPDKEDDRARHIQIVGAQTGPALLAYRVMPELDSLLAGACAGPAQTDFVDESGVQHQVWVIDDEIVRERIRTLTGKIGRLYIADGHHRTAAAVRVFEMMKGQHGTDAFLAVMFPHDQLKILPYNRALRGLGQYSPEELVRRLREVMTQVDWIKGTQPRLHEVDFYVSGHWYRFEFRELGDGKADPLKSLDVVMLQEQVLKPVFGIVDPRRDERIEFVGGLRGNDDLVRRVDSGELACAFLLHPTRIEDMMAIADAGGLLPPKSTWFEPKLRDGLFTHRFSS